VERVPEHLRLGRGAGAGEAGEVADVAGPAPRAEQGAAGHGVLQRRAVHSGQIDAALRRHERAVVDHHAIGEERRPDAGAERDADRPRVPGRRAGDRLAAEERLGVGREADGTHAEPLAERGTDVDAVERVELGDPVVERDALRVVERRRNGDAHRDRNS
jgi:hypothetical protein